MADLQRIADEKIEAERARVIDRLPGKIAAIKRQHAPRGLGGNTLSAIAGECASAVESLKGVAEDRYGWVIRETWFLTQTRATSLINGVTTMLELVRARGVELVTQEATAMRAPNAIPELTAEVNTRHQHAVQDLRLSLEATYETSKRGRARAAFEAIAKFLRLGAG